MPATVNVKYLKSLLDNHKQPYSKLEAWLYLIVNSDADGKLNYSLKKIADDFKWSIGKVRLFLEGKKDIIKRDKNSLIINNIDSCKIKVQRGKAKKQETTIEKPKDYIDQIVDIFAEEYFNEYRIDYVIEKGKDRSAASRILAEYKKVYKFSDSASTLIGLRNLFKLIVKINDKWMQDNMSLPIIRSKFNSVKKYLRNGQYQRSESEQSDEITSIVNSVFNATGNK